MAGFSIDAALKSGFRLARREPLAVLVWGGVYMLAGLVAELIVIGPGLPRYLRTAAEDPEAASAVLQQATDSNAIFTYPLMFAVALAAASVVYGAVIRAQLRPEERRGFFLRLSRRELWMALTTLVLVLAAAPLGLVAAAVVMVAASGGWVGMVLAVIAMAVGGLYLAARFAPSVVQAFAEKRLVFRDAWRLTRGQGWRIVLMMLALMFLLLIIAAVVMIPAVILGMILLGVAGMAGGATAVIVGIVVLLAGLGFLAGFYGVILAATMSAYVEVYRALKAEGPGDAPDPVSAPLAA
jgi:hypothetical protein